LERILICADLHGDHSCAHAVKSLLKHKEKFRPHHLIMLGDIWDFASLRKGASAAERNINCKADFDAGCDFIKAFFKGKAKSKVVMWGNHDHRIIEAVDSTCGITSDFAGMIYTDIKRLFNRCGVTDYEWDTSVIHELYPFRFIHGMTSALNTPSINAKTYAGKFPCVITGHNHFSGYWREPSYDRKESYSCPCLCDLKPDYARRNYRKLRMSQGWIYGFFEGDDYQLYTTEKKNGKFTCASEFKAY